MSENKVLTPERLREEAKKLYDNGNAPTRGRRVEVTAIQTLQDAADLFERRDAVIKQLVEASGKMLKLLTDAYEDNPEAFVEFANEIVGGDKLFFARASLTDALAAAEALERERDQ